MERPGAVRLTPLVLMLRHTVSIRTKGFPMFHRPDNFILNAAKRVAPDEFQRRSILAGNAPPILPASVQAPRRKSQFSRLIDALHASRRAQATELIRRYGHLVGPEYGKYQQPCLKESNNADQN
jgi:hypothetical protein